MAQTPQNPAVQQMVTALRGLPQPHGTYVPNYTPPVANLNPNLPKAALRVQQVATGISKPTEASWG